MSFQIAIDPNRKAATRFIGKVRRRLRRALADNPDITRSQIADAIGVHRSVITKQLNGHADMSLGRIAEIAWAAGYRPQFDLVAVDGGKDVNWDAPAVPARQTFVVSQSTGNSVATVSPSRDQTSTSDRVLVGAE